MSVAPVGDLDGLRRQIAATQTRVATLATRLAQAATAMAATGMLPPDALLREVRDATQAFQSLRAGLLEAAAALEIAPPGLPGVASVHDLGPLMDTIVSAAEQAGRRRRLDAARSAAFSVLNRVPAIVHREDPCFAPLVACHDKALALRAVITAADPTDVEAETDAWWGAVAPFAALLELIAGGDARDDTRWSDLEQVVGDTFGQRLASAAARGALVLR